jgi:hypothetical protein
MERELTADSPIIEDDGITGVIANGIIERKCDERSLIDGIAR